jgi:hypothetical protein
MFTKVGNQLIATERLCLNREQSEVVKDSDPRAAFLLAGKGMPIPAGIVKKLGLTTDEPAKAPGPEKGTEPSRRSRRPATPDLTR